ncbi:Thioredoxin-like_superfamily [Hexamita inflata]|uniref:Thioredoxin-like superfamily n=1 Tax=Hexamita inflata TaxID=28002 RepID=A0AA86UAD7_9EUKA|nr:Thioredoxin-like superfamily [Hexamita inflata]
MLGVLCEVIHTIQTNMTQPVFLKLCIPNFPHCQQMESVFKDAAKKQNISFENINCEENHKICDIAARYPTYYLINQNETTQYTGLINVDAMSLWLHNELNDYQYKDNTTLDISNPYFKIYTNNVKIYEKYFKHQPNLQITIIPSKEEKVYAFRYDNQILCSKLSEEFFKIHGSPYFQENIDVHKYENLLGLKNEAIIVIKGNYNNIDELRHLNTKGVNVALFQTNQTPIMIGIFTTDNLKRKSEPLRENISLQAENMIEYLYKKELPTITNRTEIFEALKEHSHVIYQGKNSQIEIILFGEETELTNELLLYKQFNNQKYSLLFTQRDESNSRELEKMKANSSLNLVIIKQQKSVNYMNIQDFEQQMKGLGLEIVDMKKIILSIVVGIIFCITGGIITLKIVRGNDKDQNLEQTQEQ